MGQNIRPIQQILLNLENSRLISSCQYDQFLQDYSSHSNRLDAVYQFFQSPNLHSFLRYYLLCKFSEKQENISRHFSSKQQLEDQFLLIAQNQTKQHFISYCQILLQSLKQCKRKVCQLLLNYSVESMIAVLSFFAKVCLNIEKYELTINRKERTLTYESKQNTVKENDKIAWQQNFRRYEKYQQDKMKGQKQDGEEDFGEFLYYFRKNQEQYLVDISFQNNNKRLVTLKCFENHLFRQHFQYFITRVANNIEETESQSKKRVCLAAIFLISLQIMIHNQFMKQEVLTLFSVDRNINGSWLQLLCEVERKDQLLKFGKSQVLHKYDRKIERESESLKEYIQLINQNQCFLDFDKYSQLSFCFLQSDNPMIGKLTKYWSQKRTKIIDILGDSQILMDRLNFLVKSMSFEGITVVKTDNYTAKIWTGKNSMLQRLQIFFYQASERIDRSLSRFKQTRYEEARSIHDRKINQKEKISSRQSSKSGKQQQQNVFSIEMIQHKDLNTLSFSISKLKNLICFRMKQSSFLGYLIIKQQNIEFFNNFISQVVGSYEENHNFYHNLSHVADVLNLCSFLTTRSVIKEYLTDFELFCIQLAALCHDIGNRGFTNKFQIDSSSDISIKYNDSRPLQNFAASKAIKLLKEKKNNFLESLQSQQYRKLKKLLIENILNTDDWIDRQISGKLKTWKLMEKEKKIEESRILSFAILNISEQSSWCKDFSIVQSWSSFLYQEHSHENSYAVQLGLAYPNPSIKSQKSWNYFLFQQLNSSILPLYKELYQIVRDQQLSEMIQKLKQSISEIKILC